MKAVLFDFMGVVGYSRMAVAGDPGTGRMRILVYDGIVDALRQLRDAGFKLALVSNNDRSSFVHFAPDVAASLEELFDVVVYSSDVGVEKPNPAIYEFALQSLGIAAIDAHYFDDLPRNVDAAVALGMSGTIVTSTQDVLTVVEELCAK